MNIDFAQLISAETRAAEALAEARGQARAQILAALARVVQAITGPVPVSEMLSWPAKEMAARAWVAGEATEADRALIEGEAAMTGEDAAALARRVLDRAEAYRAAVAALTGLRRAAEAALEAAGDAGTVSQVTAATLERLASVAAKSG
jgi:hypothetical protein